MKTSPQKKSLAYAKRTLACETSALDGLKRLFNKDLLATVGAIAEARGTIVTTGIGKSGYIAMKMAATFASFGIQAHFMHPTEALHGDSGVLRHGDVLIVFSFSGSTGEIVRTVKHIRSSVRPTIISITGRKKSPLASLSDHVLVTPIKDEGSPHGMAPMGSTLVSLAVADILVSAVVGARDIEPEQFAKAHPGGNLGLRSHLVKEHMATKNRMPIVSSKTSLQQALRVISSKRFGVGGVVDERGKIKGVISDGDIRRFMMKHASIESYVAADAMTKSPKTTTPDTSLETALALMERYKITSLFVTDKARKVVGIIHIHDILDL